MSSRDQGAVTVRRPAAASAAPATPFSQSDLLVNAEGQPNIGSELKAELGSADSVDLICAFVIWSGVRHLRDVARRRGARGGRIRVVTTTYMGATEKRAVDELFNIGARDPRRVRCTHDEAAREGVASGAGIGLDHRVRRLLEPLAHRAVRRPGVERAAVVDGRGSRRSIASGCVREPLGVRALRAYDPAVNGEDLERALEEHDRRSLGEVSTISFANLDVRPYPHQQRMLDALIDRARPSRPSSQPCRRCDRNRQDRRRGARLPPAPGPLRPSCRYCSSLTANRSSASRLLPTERSCGAATSAKSTVADELPGVATSSR